MGPNCGDGVSPVLVSGSPRELGGFLAHGVPWQALSARGGCLQRLRRALLWQS